MHSPVYLAICTVSLSSMLWLGAPGLTSTVLGSTLAIAVLGVPHGGLDHWTGRRLLRERFKDHWWAIFFPAYLLVGLVFALGWIAAPTTSVVLFFLISAWHFGREDQQASNRSARWSSTERAARHVAAVAVGGLVIWVPALARPDEMRSLLQMIVPAESIDSAIRIVDATRMVASVLVPLAIGFIIASLVESPLALERWVPVATVAIAIFAPILISFSVYFCGWHSWLGLQRLRREESLSVAQFVRHVAPLSVAAILGVAVAGWWLQGAAVDSILQGQTSPSLRIVFIGLSAIAVPHLLLHELDSSIDRSPSIQEVC
ncbi:MAG TPA: hypothetical protein DDZ51_04445 [Planctomycetaceae bacterium]|nr:hypothetical protein [Planctomycetaceae bacterium]